MTRRQIVEIVLLAPATFLLFPFLLVGALGMAIAEIAGGAMDWAPARQIFWALAGAAGIVALWMVVLKDGGTGLPWRARITLTVGMLLGIVSAVRWLSLSATSGHKYGAMTLAVWLVLLGGPLVAGGLRLIQLWSSPHEGPG